MLAPQKLGESCEQGLRGEEAQKIVSAIFQLCLNASHSCTAPESPKQLWPLTPQLLTTPPFLAPSFSVSSVCTSHCFKTYPHLALSLLPLSLAFLCLLLLFMIFSLLPSAVHTPWPSSPLAPQSPHPSSPLAHLPSLQQPPGPAALSPQQPSGPTPPWPHSSLIPAAPWSHTPWPRSPSPQQPPALQPPHPSSPLAPHPPGPSSTT